MTEEAVSVTIEEENRIRLQAGARGFSGVKSALAVFNSGNTRFKGETKKSYNCSEVGHLKQACPKPPNGRDSGGWRQSGGRGRGRGGGRGGRGGYWIYLMVVGEEKEVDVGFSEEDLIIVEDSQILRRRQKGASEGKSAYDILALASIPTTRSLDWVVDSGATRHVTSAAGKFSSYTYLTIRESI